LIAWRLGFAGNTAVKLDLLETTMYCPGAAIIGAWVWYREW
jgi:hypothetical protein